MSGVDDRVRELDGQARIHGLGGDDLAASGPVERRASGADEERVFRNAVGGAVAFGPGPARGDCDMPSRRARGRQGGAVALADPPPPVKQGSVEVGDEESRQHGVAGRRAPCAEDRALPIHSPVP